MQEVDATGVKLTWIYVEVDHEVRDDGEQNRLCQHVRDLYQELGQGKRVSCIVSRSTLSAQHMLLFGIKLGTTLHG